ncbi:hypothetical protein X740_33340 [Mesorhizobium sp. LNHC221B00]|uniref:hypothetical protein n=1 Tax=Mesorhizobium sp. LNHC221B00 TaxID=1287233 RepID=UPI0003CE74B7|nr:hypothetical protein [Mesorhizobium sp. LNHC221B00]ESY72335.1 hypothetical protein X740_33340 [Mesorhizobium sp. LNHC221B00]
MAVSLSSPEPAGLLYRFSVKCDRDMNAAIEKAAKASGMSATGYVQKHFEGILTAARMPIDQPPPMAVDPTRDFDVATSIGITVTALRLYRAMDHAKDGNGNVQMSMLALADAAGVAPASVKTFQHKLMRRGLIKEVRPASHRTPAIYHVFSIGDQR